MNSRGGKTLLSWLMTQRVKGLKKQARKERVEEAEKQRTKGLGDQRTRGLCMLAYSRVTFWDRWAQTSSDQLEYPFRCATSSEALFPPSFLTVSFAGPFERTGDKVRHFLASEDTYFAALGYFKCQLKDPYFTFWLVTHLPAFYFAGPVFLVTWQSLVLMIHMGVIHFTLTHRLRPLASLNPDTLLYPSVNCEWIYFSTLFPRHCSRRMILFSSDDPDPWTWQSHYPTSFPSSRHSFNRFCRLFYFHFFPAQRNTRKNNKISPPLNQALRVCESTLCELKVHSRQLNYYLFTPNAS